MSENLQQEFIALLDTNQGIIHKVCNLYFSNSRYREDAYQEIIFQLWKAYPGFKKESKFSTWMYRVALNTVLTQFKKEKRRKNEQSIGKNEMSIPENVSTKESNARLLLKAVSLLPEIDRAIIMLHLDEKSYDEIAEITGLTRTNVGVRINRAKLKLESIIKQLNVV